MSYIPAKYNYEITNSDAYDFDLRDAKGRKVGCYVKKQIITVTDKGVPLQGYCGTVSKPEDLGVWYAYSLQSTRDSKLFGASPKTMKFRTLTEMTTAATKAELAARRRAAKTHGKGK